MSDQTITLAVIIIYFIIVIGVGYYFYHRSTNLSDYILGGRSLNPYVTALSAQASDMSGWLLMGLPGSIYVAGMGEVWIGIGLAIGSYLAWLLIAKRLRIYSEKAKNSLTLSEYFENRFHDKSGWLRTVSAVIILFFFTIYVASGFVGAGNVFRIIFPDFSYTVAMIIGAVVVISYTFLGGFRAVCWTDLLQALLMIFAIILVPLAVINDLGGWDTTMDILDNMMSEGTIPDHFTSLFYDDGESIAIATVISCLAWGLGYFGMPHVVVRYTAIKNPKDLKISRRVATIWMVICLAAACVMAIVGRAYFPDESALVGDNPENIFISLADSLFPAALAAVIYSALLAAIMSTADSQLLVASGAVSNDLYNRLFKKKADDKKLMWIARGVVIVIAVIAALLALDRDGAIMDLVSYAWAGFGAAFGPAVILSLFWKKTNAKGVIWGMLTGFVTIILWNTFLVSGGIIAGGDWCIFDTGLYELVPGFLFSLIVTIAVSLYTGGADEEVQKEYEDYEAAVADPDWGSDPEVTGPQTKLKDQ